MAKRNSKNYGIGSYTILGDRPSQQDAYMCENAGNVLVASVCDGMGGMQGGEKASKTAVLTFSERAQRIPPASIDDAADWLRATFTEADKRIFALTGENGERLYAGSTSVAVVLAGNKLQWGCVGDSRIYMLRRERIETVTRMHNYNLRLDQMVQSGELNEQERKAKSARGEALISYLGIGGLPLIDTTRNPITLQKEDIIVLCSDGLYKSLDPEQITAIITESGKNMEIAARRLCENAHRLAKKKQDNTTVVVIRYTGDI